MPTAATAMPIVLVAHSLRCRLVAARAAHSRPTARVAAALLAAPPDTERDDMPPTLFNLRVPSGQMASDWGSATLVIGARGHVNGESGLGDWPEG